MKNNNIIEEIKKVINDNSIINKFKYKTNRNIK